jgi:hypothetical protein
MRRNDGSATVEHVALAALIALLVIAAISALAADPRDRAGRALGGTIARKIRCAPRLPDPCDRNPLALAYGFPLGKLVRSLAPQPAAAAGPGGLGLVPVDFRRCRRPSCAVPSGRPGLTTSGRRITAFTQVEDRRRSRGAVLVTFWLYRPGLGWEAVRREAGAAEIESASKLRLRITDVPALVPLETLPGHDHYEFPAGEEPPWRWRVEDVYPG